MNQGAGWTRSSPTCWRPMRTAPSSLGALAAFRGLTYFILHYSPHTPLHTLAIRTLFLNLTRRPGAPEQSASGLRPRLNQRQHLRPRARTLIGRQRRACAGLRWVPALLRDGLRGMGSAGPVERRPWRVVAGNGGPGSEGSSATSGATPEAQHRQRYRLASSCTLEHYACTCHRTGGSGRHA